MPVPDPAHHIHNWIATYDTPTTSVAHLLCDRHSPHTTATTEIGPTLTATTLTFGELTERSRALAGGLAQLGITTGDRVATLIPKGIDLTITALATWRLGAVLVPLLSSLAPSAIAQRLKNSHTRLVVCDAEYRNKLDPVPDTPPPPPPTSPPPAPTPSAKATTPWPISPDKAPEPHHPPTPPSEATASWPSSTSPASSAHHAAYASPYAPCPPCTPTTTTA